MPSYVQRLFPHLFSYHDPYSFVNRARARRAHHIRQYFSKMEKVRPTVRILDIGGTHLYWQTIGLFLLGTTYEYHITLLNKSRTDLAGDLEGFAAIEGDACRLEFERGDFDIVFSNSVIEHLGSFENQKRMASEVRRISDNYVIETPCLFFPLEPHSHVPGFQFLPHWVRAILIRNFSINYFPKKETLRECVEVSKSTLMLTKRKFQRLFPDATIHVERFLGLAKSYTAIHGFGEEAHR